MMKRSFHLHAVPKKALTPIQERTFRLLRLGSEQLSPSRLAPFDRRSLAEKQCPSTEKLDSCITLLILPGLSGVMSPSDFEATVEHLQHCARCVDRLRMISRRRGFPEKDVRRLISEPVCGSLDSHGLLEGGREATRAELQHFFHCAPCRGALLEEMWEFEEGLAGGS